MNRIHSLFRKNTLRQDAVSGLVLGVESVPDGLASGLLAGVNPVYGLYGYLFGTFSGAFATSSHFMAVQATGAMAIIVADVALVHNGEDPERALFTLAVLTGVVMILAGLLKLGSWLRFVSHSVMVGFISAVGLNIVLGQLDNFTGYESEGSNRVLRAFDLLVHPFDVHLATLTVGVVAIVLILVLERSKLGALGMVVAVFLASGMVALFDWEVLLLSDIAEIPGGLPGISLPKLSYIPSLILPAASLAFVGLVQGAGISASFPNPDGEYPDDSQDFVGQGVGNVVAGLFQGMPVGGSMSASSLAVNAGAKSRLALMIAGAVMAIVVLLFTDLVGHIAMPALAGLLIIIGVRTVKVDDLVTVWNTGAVQQMVMAVTFGLTMLIPLQYAVLVGVAMSAVLFIVRQSNQITVVRYVLDDSGRVREEPAPPEVGSNDVLVLQPQGSLFFAAAPAFEQQLPAVTERSRNSVVILRMRSREDIGSTLIEVVTRYAGTLNEVGSKLMLVSVSDRIREQIDATGTTDIIGAENIYPTSDYLGEAVRQANADALEWIAAHRPESE
jgi:SulP family sulfate permease